MTGLGAVHRASGRAALRRHETETGPGLHPGDARRDLLLLDEPTVGVDPVSRRELWAIVDRLVERGRDERAALAPPIWTRRERCAEVILLHQGRVIGQGSPRHFSAELRGRTFAVTAPDLNATSPAGTAWRGLPGVLDAVIQGEAVRVVTAEPRPPDLSGIRQRGRLSHRSSRASRTASSPAAAGPRQDPSCARARDAVGGDVAGRCIAGAGADATVRRLLRGRRSRASRCTPGEVFGLLGANGAGKTTTFRMLCGLLPASAGQAAGGRRRSAPRRRPARARIGYMSQKFSLYGQPVGRAESEFLRAAPTGCAARRPQDRVALGAGGLRARRPRRSGERRSLPLGYKQRLAMAAALMHEPDILFLDEPTSGVDPLARREFWRRINALAEARRHACW